jgi:biotin carboxyl carrier protein
MLLKFFNTVVARLILSLGIIGALGMVAADRLLYRSSIDAVVNAPRIEVVAPAEGVIAALPIRPGSTVAVGATVAAIQRTSWSQGVADEIGVRVTQLRTQVAALDDEAAALRALRAELRARVVRHRASSVAQLADEERAIRASAEESRRAYARLRALRDANSATEAEVEVAQSASVRADAALARVREAGRAVAGGVVTEPMGGGAQDVPYSQQRVDDLTIQLAQLAAAQATAVAELRALEAQLGMAHSPTTGERADTAAAADRMPVGTIALVSHSGGVVWSVPHALGSIVMKGAVVATLVDCAEVFLEARISPRDEAAIRAGQPVTFRFVGERTELPGTVAYVRGGGVRADAQTVAHLATGPRAATDGRVVIAPDARAMGAVPRNSCHVGRSVKVSFGRRGAAPETLATR